MKKVLVAIPLKPSLNPHLRDICVAGARLLPQANPTLDINILFDYSAVAKEAGDSRPWSKVARARNRLLDKVNINHYDYVLWIDADVVKYPLDMPTKLIAGNPNGVSAPMVLIQGGDQFYDWAAFVMADKDTIMPESRKRIWGRNLQHQPPYWHYHKEPHIEDDRNARPDWYKPAADSKGHVEMDCVGTITMVPTWIYKDGIRYEDHPAFTDHYPICKACRDEGIPVTVDTSCVAYHADLPRFGEKWH
jgi:hypothetical protein